MVRTSGWENGKIHAQLSPVREKEVCSQTYVRYFQKDILQLDQYIRR